MVLAATLFMAMLAFAYGTGNPQVVGHTADEIDAGPGSANGVFGAGDYSFPSKVGINNATFARRLNIKGEISLQGYPTGIYFGNLQAIYDDANGGLTINVPNPLSILTLSTAAKDINIKPGTPGNVIMVPVTGKVGIGTTTPGAPLHVSNTAMSQDIIRLTNGVGTYKLNDYTFTTPSSFLIRTGAGYLSLETAYASSDAGIRFKEGADEVMRIVGGKVGIGIATPTEKLDVVGNIKASGTICDGTGACIGNSSNLWSQNGSNIYYNGGKVGIGTAAPQAALHISYLAGGSLYAQGASKIGGGGAFDNSHTLSILGGSSAEPTLNVGKRADQTADIIDVGSDNGDIMVVKADGKVGIGTTAPQGKLHVATTGNANALFINDTTGRVGIGVGDLHPAYTTSMLSVKDEIDVVDSLSPAIKRIYMAYPAGIGISEIGSQALVGLNIVSGHSASPYMSFIVSNGTAKMDAMRITGYSSGGNVGIGTTAPTEKLEVNGKIKVTGLAGSGNYVCIDASGVLYRSTSGCP